MQIKQNNLRQITNLVAIIAAFGMNIWANLAPPNGMTIGEISQKIFGNVLITPANYAFAIWGLIYLGLISFAIYQALPSQRDNSLLQKLGFSLAIASIAQIGWLFLFLYRQFAQSFGAMLIILMALLTGYLRLPQYPNSRSQKWLILIPVSIYTAWISMATILNGAIVLTAWSWNGWGISPTLWTVVMLVIAGIIGALITIQRADLPYTGVLVWALIAISVRNSDIVAIQITAISLVIVLILLLIFRLFRSQFVRKKI